MGILINNNKHHNCTDNSCSYHKKKRKIEIRCCMSITTLYPNNLPVRNIFKKESVSVSTVKNNRMQRVAAAADTSQ